MRYVLALTLLLTFTAAPALSDELPPEQQIARLVRDGEHAEAIELGRRLTGAGTASVSVWFHYASALHATGDYRGAIAAFRNVGREGNPSPRAKFHIAASYARLGDSDQAIASLESAIDSGFRDVDLVESSADLASLRRDVRYQQLHQMLLERVKPCLTFPEHHQLDFWIGKWEQQNKAGAVVGTTTVTAAKLGCALLENTENPPHYTATVIHTFDRETNRWRQFYVDSAAKIIRYEGSRDGDRFTYHGEMQKNEKRIHLRNVMEPVDPDRIRWVYDESEDGGATWVTKFDGFYVRRK